MKYAIFAAVTMLAFIERNRTKVTNRRRLGSGLATERDQRRTIESAALPSNKFADASFFGRRNVSDLKARICGALGTSEMLMPEHTIVVVDDDVGVRKSLGRLLSAFGYRVEAFPSAEEFLRAAPTSTARCLIVDFNLGDVSGLELARRLSADGFEFSIIFMTGAADDTVRMQCTEFGCVAFLHKPFLQDRLMQAIRKATSINAAQVRPDGSAQHRMTGVGPGHASALVPGSRVQRTQLPIDL